MNNLVWAWVVLGLGCVLLACLVAGEVVASYS